MRPGVAALVAAVLAAGARAAAAQPAEAAPAAVDPAETGSGAQCWFAPPPDPTSTATATATPTPTPTSTSTSTSTPTATSTSTPTATSTSTPTAPLQPASQLPAPIRPLLLVGLGGGGGGFALSADLGLRIAPVMAWFAYRGIGLDGGLVSYASGRVGWVFAEASWIACYAAGGGGKLRYIYNVGPGYGTAGVVAFSAEVGVQLFPRAFAGPGLAVAVEALAPLPRTPDPRNGLLSAPAVLILFDLNPLYLLLHPFVW